MLGALKAVEVYVEKIIIRNRFNIMISKGLATEEVKSTVDRILGKEERKKQTRNREEKRVMTIRKRNIEKEMRKAKYQWYERSQELRQIMKHRTARKEYYNIEREYRDYIWRTKVKISKEKIRKAKVKQDKENKNKNKDERDNYRFYKVLDKELRQEEPLPMKNNFEVYGNVALSENEKQCLSLGPKYMIDPKLNRENFEVEIEMECIKTRFELKEREKVQEEKEKGNITEKDMKEAREKNRKDREILDEKNLRMSHLAVTDTKYNVRSFFPREAEEEDEHMIQNRRRKTIEVFDEHINCSNKRKNFKISNMTKEEIKGKESLQKRSKEGEIVITTTDKSGKYAVVEKDLYIEAANVHLNDEEISIEEARKIETLMNRHAIQYVKAMNMGTYHGKEGQQTRMRKAMRSEGAQPGPVQFLIKDHKKVKEGEKIPPTRQVCSAKSGPSSRMSNLISMILNKAADNMNNETECRSTEELKKEILDTNREIENKSEENNEYKQKIKQAEIISLDVKALYPSLKVEEVKKIINEMLTEVQREGNLNFQDIDYYEVGKYIKVACTEEEIRENRLENIIPERTAGNRGQRPTAAYWDNDVRVQVENGIRKEVPKWKETNTQPEKDEKERMISLMIVKAVEIIMKNHTYRFNNKYYKQSDGGPIGDELSQAVARIVMLWFDRKFKEACIKENIELVFYKRYVDDSNMLVIPSEEIKMKAEWKDEEEGNNAKLIAAECRKVADSISQMLKFEEDIGEEHEDGKLPILDMKVWTTIEKNTKQIKHSFYKKPMASKYTLRKGTAYPLGNLRAVLTEEILRRLRNCSPEMTWEEKGKFLTEYAKELQASGHNEKFRKEIMEKAVRIYKKDLEEHEKGNRDMYRSRKDREEQIKNKGKADKSNWFRGDEENAETSILRVPYTKGAVLKRKMNTVIQTERRPNGTKTKVQEDSGDKLVHQLIKPDPFAGDTCGRRECRTVTKGTKGPCRGTCWQQHVNYTVICKKCEERAEKGEGKRSLYIGESSRGCNTRFQRELRKVNPKDKGYMQEHIEKEHGGNANKEDFVIKRHSVDKDVMRRIVRESIRIETNEKDPTIKLMNRKEEHFGTVTVRSNFGIDWGTF